jgi:hypothetical protein
MAEPEYISNYLDFFIARAEDLQYNTGQSGGMCAGGLFADLAVKGT